MDSFKIEEGFPISLDQAGRVGMGNDKSSLHRSFIPCAIGTLCDRIETLPCE